MYDGACDGATVGYGVEVVGTRLGRIGVVVDGCRDGLRDGARLDLRLLDPDRDGGGDTLPIIRGIEVSLWKFCALVTA